jgi:ketosteroid isomerase-like protein
MAVVTSALTALGKGDMATLGLCLAERVVAIAVDPQTGVPTPIFFKRQDLLDHLQQNGPMDLLAGRKLVDVTAQAGPGDVVLVNYSLGAGGAAANADADRAVIRPTLGPFWALVGKLNGHWQLIAFTVSLSPPG